MGRRLLSKTAILLLIAFGVGVLGAFGLYRWAGQGEFFSWSVSTLYSPLVAVGISALSALIVLAWLTSMMRPSTTPRNRALVAFSIMWIGFGFAMAGPLLLGQPGSWNQPGSWKATNSGEGLESTIYDLSLSVVELPSEVIASLGPTPGPYLAQVERQDGGAAGFVAVNMNGSQYLEEGQALEPGKVVLLYSENILQNEFSDPMALTDLDPRIQHVRDLETIESGIVLSNVELRESCWVLQVWTIDISFEPLRATNPTVIWESTPCVGESASSSVETSRGSGGRLALEPSGSFLLTVGDFAIGPTGAESFGGRSSFVDESGDYGKIWRINRDGSSQIVSTGHRNPQGLTVDTSKGRIWSTEHGPSGGDELNLIIENRDYGWPDSSYGVPYGLRLPQAEWLPGRWNSHAPEFESPVFSWLPSVAPSQVIVYRGETFAAWDGDVLVSTLKDMSIRRLRLSDQEVVYDERIFVGERIRDIVALDDGRLWLSFDSGGLGVLDVGSKTS